MPDKKDFVDSKLSECDDLFDVTLHYVTKFYFCPICKHLKLEHYIAVYEIVENLVGKEKMLVTSIFSFFHNVFKSSPWDFVVKG